jgi:hypothetical protein
MAPKGEQRAERRKPGWAELVALKTAVERNPSVGLGSGLVASVGSAYRNEQGGTMKQRKNLSNPPSGLQSHSANLLDIADIF